MPGVPPQLVWLLLPPLLSTIADSHALWGQTEGWVSPLSHAPPSTKGPNSKFPGMPLPIWIFLSYPLHPWPAGNRKAKTSS